jgi:hypothetical protein
MTTTKLQLHTKDTRKDKRERRARTSLASRALIGSTVGLAFGANRQKILAPELINQLREELEPVITRDLLVSDAKLLTRPRQWIKDTQTVVSDAFNVTVTIEKVKRVHLFRVSGRWGDVQLAEYALLKIMTYAPELATREYRTSYRSSPKSARGARRRWLQNFGGFLIAAHARAKARLEHEHGSASARTSGEIVIPDVARGVAKQA